MAKLIFFDDKHEYRVGEQILPSVSEIIRFISREIYDTVNQYTMDNAADRGTKVHKATENLDRYSQVECPEDVVQYVQAYVAFRKQYDPEWSRIEYACYHPGMEFAGTLDRYGIIKGNKTILDIKTTATIHKQLVTAQLNGYKKLAEANGLAVEELAVLQLKKDGTFKYQTIPIDDTLFMSCYNLHMATKKKQKKKGDK